MQSKHLRVEVAGFPINDYRISKGYLELRMLDPRGRSYPDARSSGMQLNASDIAFSFRAANRSSALVSRQARYQKVTAAGR